MSKKLGIELLVIRAAHAEALQHALRGLIALIRDTGGYMTPEQQAQLAHARYVLAESEALP